jgi:DNA topoisomerase IB
MRLRRVDWHTAGLDARGRRQYRYHNMWRFHRDRDKFDHMLEFARALPGLRRRCAEALRATDELTCDRVLVCATRLLDLGFFRIGTEGNDEENQTYGLATIRKEHVTLDGDVATFDYTSKTGKRRVQSVIDPEVAEVIGGLKRRRGGGPELLAYRRDGRWVDVKSTDINRWIKEQTGGDFSAKDFRTWAATVLAAVALSVSTGAASPTARKKAVTRAVQEVAHHLGNTPAVCRASYIDPRVIDCYVDGETVRKALDALGADPQPGQLAIQGRVEAAVVRLLGGGDSGLRAAS